MVRHGEHLITSLVRKFHLIQNPMELVFRIAAECAPVSIVIQGEHPPAGGELHRIGVRFRVEGDSLVQAEIVVELEQFLRVVGVAGSRSSPTQRIGVSL